MIKVTITTTNTFESVATYLAWKRAMQISLSIVDFDELEKTGSYAIESGTAADGSKSEYTFEVKK